MSGNELSLIDADELLNKIKSHKIKKNNISKYIIPMSASTNSMLPEFQPNYRIIRNTSNDFSSSLLDIINSATTVERQATYRRKIKAGFSGHSIVDEGDSWYQHPLSWDIIDFLYSQKDSRYAFYSMSAGGDTFGDIDLNKTIKAIEEIEPSAFTLSAGGNDLLGGGNIARYIEDVKPNMTAHDLVGRKFDTFLKSFIKEYSSFLLAIHSRFPEMFIFIHGYAPAIPREYGPHIGLPLKKIKVWPLDVQRRVVEIMFGKLSYELTKLTRDKDFGGKLVHVDFTEFGRNKRDWADELHLQKGQCKKAAEKLISIILHYLPTLGEDQN